MEKNKTLIFSSYKNLLNRLSGGFPFCPPVRGEGGIKQKATAKIICFEVFMEKIICKELGCKVLGMAYKVHNILGPGLLESAYEDACFVELVNSGL